MPRRRHLLLAAGLAVGAAATVGLPWSADDSGGAGDPAQLILATGPQGGVYRAIGGELLNVLAKRFPRTRLSEHPTDGSAENLALLASDRADLGFAYLDTFAAGFAVGRPADVTAVARLYDAWMHVIVLAQSPIHSLAGPDGLNGRDVTAGAGGSGSRFTAERLFEVAGVRPRLVNASQDDGADLLAAGKVDAMVTFTGIPTPAVTRLIRSTAIRIIATDSYTRDLEKRYGEFYTPAVLPSSVYLGVKATGTLTTPTLLLARPDLSADVVEVVAEALFTERSLIARKHPDANRINIRTGIATGPVPLHPGALRYFRSVKP